MELTTIKLLLKKYREGTCTPQEKAFVEKWYAKLIETGELDWENDEKELTRKLIETRLLQNIGDSETNAKTNFFHRLKPAYRWAVAASIILAISVGFLLVNKNNAPKQNAIVQTLPDVAAPITNQAYLTFANGEKTPLNHLKNQDKTIHGNIEIKKSETGEIIYHTATTNQNSSSRLNTITNPQGSTIAIVQLPDGTKVWLNAGASLTYPVVFTGKEREVSMDGEAYFEVAHNANKPFKVKRKDFEVAVLGTHFNISANDGGSKPCVTLLEGSVKVSRGIEKALIEPGQQVIIDNGALVKKQSDTESVMAWKNGYFELGGATLQEILSQLSRWYNVPVVYQTKINERRFGGQISRSVNLSDVLKILQAGGLNLKFDGQKIIVAK